MEVGTSKVTDIVTILLDLDPEVIVKYLEVSAVPIIHSQRVMKFVMWGMTLGVI